MSTYQTESMIPRKRARLGKNTNKVPSPSQNGKASSDLKETESEIPSALVQQNFSLIAEVKDLLKTKQDDALAFEGKLLARINRGEYKNLMELMKENLELVNKIRDLLTGRKLLSKAFDRFLLQAVNGQIQGDGPMTSFEKALKESWATEYILKESFLDPGGEEDCAESLNRLSVGNEYFTPLSPRASPETPSV
jgi:hypothetical protein